MNTKLISPKCFMIALALTALGTAAHAQQQTDKAKQERQAACEQQRLACQASWAQTNSAGVPVTPPDKTKLC